MLATGRPSSVSAAVAAAAPPAVDRFPEMQALVADRRPDRPVQPMSDTGLIGCGRACAGHRHRGGLGPVLMSGTLADTAYRLLPA
jgi:hypothetical protein